MKEEDEDPAIPDLTTIPLSQIMALNRLAIKQAIAEALQRIGEESGDQYIAFGNTP